MRLSRLPRGFARRLSALGGAGYLLLALLAGAAAAADLPPAASAPPAPAPVGEADTLVVSGTLYLWATALSGTSSTLPLLPPANIDLRFRDVLENLDGGIMGTAEMRRGRWSVVGDVMFTQVSPGGTLPGPSASEVEMRSRSLTLQGDVLYRVYESDALNVDAGAGLRYWHLDNTLTIEPGLLPNGLSITQTQDWVDPVIAGRLQARLGGAWSVTLTGDIGGFDIGSQLTWQAIGTMNYQWNENLSLRAGYRALSVDYETDGFVYDVLMQGPILGATYRF